MSAREAGRELAGAGRAACVRESGGFTLVELMLVMAITLFVMTAATQVLVALIMQFRQQTKIAETSVESLIGLEVLRVDLKTAGYGLPWEVPAGVVYNDFDLNTVEAGIDPGFTARDNAPNAPQAFVILDGKGPNGSDVFIVKSALTASAPSAAGIYNSAGNWHTHILDEDSNELLNLWQSSGPVDENLQDTDRVIVLTLAEEISLVADSSNNWYTTFKDIKDGGSAFAPTSRTSLYLVMGLSDNTNPDFPFNRSVYYIDDSDVPSRCAGGTGVLVKRLYNHATNKLDAPLPLLDCVADMQVIVGLDMPDASGDPDGDFEPSGAYDSYEDTIDATPLAAPTAETVRTRLAEIRIYILAQEGQFDRNYTFEDPVTFTTEDDKKKVRVGEWGLGHAGASEFDIEGNITNGLNYRWRIHKVVESPSSLRGSMQ